MKFFMVAAAMNIFIFIIFGAVGIVTTALTLLLVRYNVRRGGLASKSYVFLHCIDSGMDIIAANNLVKSMDLEQIMNFNQPAIEYACAAHNGIQMSLINEAISKGMNGGGWIDKIWSLCKMIENNKRQSIAQGSKESILAYKQSFLLFRNITDKQFWQHREASGIITDSDVHVLFIRYIVEANEAAMEHFGIHRSLWHECNLIALKELLVEEYQAIGILAGLKQEPLRDVQTNEPLDDIRGAGFIAYKEWLRGGDEIAIAKAEWLWEKGVELHNFRKQLEPLGIRF